MYPTPATEEQKARGRRLVERAREAMQASGGSRGVDQKAGWLACDERDIGAWATGLRELGERVGDYRRPGISNEELLEIARDASRPRDQRAGALFLLGRRNAEHDAARRVIEACADPALAGVLGAAHDGTLTRDALEPERARPRVRVAEEPEPEPDEEEAVEETRARRRS